MKNIPLSVFFSRKKNRRLLYVYISKPELFPILLLRDLKIDTVRHPPPTAHRPQNNTKILRVNSKTIEPLSEKASHFKKIRWNLAEKA